MSTATPTAKTPAISRPLTYLVGVAILVLAVDQLIAYTLTPKRAEPDVELRTADDVRDQVARAVAHPEPSWLLLGDSVLAGDVMAQTVPDWHSRRVVDYLRRQADADDRHGFFQVALDGMLPTDVLATLTLLDELDPDATVSVALELNLRYFSPHYRDTTTCTREHICQAAGLDDVFAPRKHDIATSVSGSLEWLGRRVPIARHRRLLDDDHHPDLAQLVASEKTAERQTPDELEARARLTAHYRGDASDPGHSQLRALDLVLGRLAAQNRRAVIFVTPLEDRFAATPGVDTWQNYGALAKRVHDYAERGAPIRFANFDGPQFGAELFLDHCHLVPEGNRLLALNLLQEMSVGLARVPAPQELLLPEATDLTLLAHMPWPTTAHGPNDDTWQYPAITPHSLAVEPGGKRLVIADATRHMVFQLRGSMQTLEPLAGQLGVAGGDDGLFGEATLDHPSSPVFVGDTLYIADRKGIRQLRQNAVKTLATGNRGHTQLASDGTFLYTLNPRAITQIAPDGSRKPWVTAQQVQAALAKLAPDPQLPATAEPDGPTPSALSPQPQPPPRQPRVRFTAFAVSPTGEMFIADNAGRIWRRPPTGNLDLIFANTSSTPLPEVYGAHYPFPFKDIGLQKIVGLMYVERYGGLLVQEERRPPTKIKDLTEIVHLHFFHLKRKQVYPWLKPLPYGDAYMPASHKGQGRVSWLHRGAMALDPVTATVFVGEFARPRLFRIGDGLYGAARIGNLIYKHQQPLGHLGSATGQAISSAFHPDQFVDTRISRLPRKGPYLGLLLGSSMTAVSDLVGQYSLGRRLEQELQTRFGLRDKLRFELYHRAFGAPSLEQQVTEAERFVTTQVAVDVVLIEIQNVTKKYFGDHPQPGPAREAWVHTQLRRLDALKRRYGTEVVFLQNEGIGRKNLDGLRPPSPQIDQLTGLIRQHGLTVVDPTQQLLPHHLEASPWGNPPFRSGRHHGSVWAIDRTAEVVATMLYPALRRHFLGNQPARLVDHSRGVQAPEPSPFASEIDAWSTDFEQLPELEPGRVQHAYDAAARQLNLFVDLPADSPDTHFSGLAARAIIIGLRDRGYAQVAHTIVVRLARFRHYDEYGRGVLTGAEIVFERRVTSTDELRDLVQAGAD